MVAIVGVCCVRVRFKAGDKVVLTGYGVGERHYGGFSQKARVKADWLVPLPSPFTTKDAMGIGTAGFTAMMCIMALERANVKALKRPILVTGGGGGVGSIAISILSNLGYEVVAVTGRPELETYLKDLGATSVVDRDSIRTTRPLDKETWGGAVDTVGGDILSGLLAQVRLPPPTTCCVAVGITIMLMHQ